jgi:hypothetical protein
MRHTLALALLLALLLVSRSHAAPAPAVDAQLVASEKSMWELWKHKDAKSFGGLLADDFFDVYLSGETAGKAALLRGFNDADLLDYRLTPMRVVRLASDARVLVYRAHIRGRVAAKALEYDVDVTSVWAVRNGAWKSVFYRETLVPAKLPWTNLTQSP